MRVDNLVGLRCHGLFYTGLICNGNRKQVFKLIVCLWIPRKVRVRRIWHKVFFKLGVSFDELVSRKKILWMSSHRIQTHLDVFVAIIEFHIIVSFNLYLDYYFIGFWWADIMFEIPHATNFHRMSTFQWWILLSRQYHRDFIESILSGDEFWFWTIICMRIVIIS